MKLSIVIVTHNSQSSITNVLRSIDNEKLHASCEIIVVDNASTDNTIPLVNKFSTVKIIINKTNKGYGAASNQGIKRTNSTYILVTNPDITFPPGTLPQLITYMEANKDIGLLSPKLIDPTGNLFYSCKRDPDLATLCLRRAPTFVQKMFAKKLEHHLMKDANHQKTMHVDVTTGAFMVLRRKAMERVGFFDERFFLYFEDFDMSKMINQIARVVYYPTVAVTHHWRGGSKRSWKLKYYHLRSMATYFNKWGWKFW